MKLKSKRVLFIVPSFMLGGMENMLVNVVNIISDEHDVTVYNLGSHDERMVERLNKKVHYFPLWMPCKNVLKFNKATGIKEYNRLLPAAQWYKFHTSEYVHKRVVLEHFDVEVAFFCGEPVKIVAGAPNDTKKIMWIHNDTKMCRGLFDSFLTKQEAVKDFRKFDSVVCVSKQAEKSYQECTGLKDTNVIYNYIDVDEVIRKSNLIDVEKKSGFSIVSVGRFVDAKGFDRLLNVAKRLQDDGFNFNLTIVGDGAEKGALISLAQNNKLRNIYFTGLQENPYPYIKNADLLVCASRYEGYNLTVAEALILGVPVLSTKCTGPTEILDSGKYGMLVDNSEEGIYIGVKELLLNKELLKKYERLAIERQSFFDVNVRRKELLSLFEG